MEVSRALDQIAEIHQRIARGELYGGYGALPLAGSGLMGMAAAWFQPVTLGAADPIGYVLYWIAIAVGAGFVGSSEILYNYVVHQDGSGRRQTRKVVGQFLPSAVAGAAITASFTHLSAALVPLLPVLWAICFGIGTFHPPPYLPRPR